VGLPTREVLLMKLNFLIAVWVLISCGYAVATPCDPYGRILTKAEHQNLKKQYDLALVTIKPVLQKAPDDFRANYIQGMILYDQANAVDQNRWNPPLPLSDNMARSFKTLIATANSVPQQNESCLRTNDLYNIYNTIGAFYLNRGYFDDAQRYLLLGYGYRNKLSSNARIHLLDNLGLVFLLQRKPSESIKYYLEAKSAGSRLADPQLRKARALKAAKS
jgi:hypothetical protein